MTSFAKETAAEILKALRAPEFILPTLLLPCGFYALFGIVLAGSGATAPYLLATYGVFAVMGPSIFGFGVGVATERELGWLQLKRTMPSPMYNYVVAKLITTVIFSAFALLPIYLMAGFLGGVELPRSTWVELFALHLVASVPFVLIGLGIGFTLSSGGAVAVANILFIGLAILGGLWMPIATFPGFMKTLAQFTPSFHLGELALSLVDGSFVAANVSNAMSIAVMTALFLILAIWAWSQQR